MPQSLLRLLVLASPCLFLSSCLLATPSEDEAWVQSRRPGVSPRGPAQEAAGPLRLCYISLNNPKEFEVTKNFVDNLHVALGLTPGEKVVVEEFQELHDSPTSTFEKLFQTQKRCDGLIISGHHTGAFGGQRANGSLDVDYLARKSCDVRTADFFAGIHALWLQGCRTLGAAEETGSTGQNMAEFHGERVNAVRRQDGLDQDQLTMEDEFSSLLDSESPYSIRFLKAFPHARVFGWTKVAPGENAASEYSLGYHVANLARRERLARGQNIKTLDHPFRGRIGRDSAAAYLRALMGVLQPAGNRSSVENEVAAWKDQGRAMDVGAKVWGYMNPDLNALEPLFLSTNAGAQEARVKDCRLANADQAVEKIAALKDLLASESSIALSFYNLQSFYKDERTDPILGSRLKGIFGQSLPLRAFLTRKLASTNVGLTRKIDYLALGRLAELPNMEKPFQEMEQKAIAFLVKAPPVGNDAAMTDMLDAKVTLIRSLLQGRVFSAERWSQILKSNKESSFQASLIRVLQTSGAESEEDGDDFDVEEFFNLVMESVEGNVDKLMLANTLVNLPVSDNFTASWINASWRRVEKLQSFDSKTMFYMTQLLSWDRHVYPWGDRALGINYLATRRMVDELNGVTTLTALSNHLLAMIGQKRPPQEVGQIAAAFQPYIAKAINKAPDTVEYLNVLTRVIERDRAYDAPLCNELILPLAKFMGVSSLKQFDLAKAYCGSTKDIVQLWPSWSVADQINAFFMTGFWESSLQKAWNPMPFDAYFETFKSTYDNRDFLFYAGLAFARAGFSPAETARAAEWFTTQPRQEGWQYMSVEGMLVMRSDWSLPRKRAWFQKHLTESWNDEYEGFFLDLFVKNTPGLVVDEKAYLEKVAVQEPLNPMRRLNALVGIEKLKIPEAERRALAKKMLTGVSASKLAMDIGFGLTTFTAIFPQAHDPAELKRAIRLFVTEASLRRPQKAMLKKAVAKVPSLDTWQKQEIYRLIDNPTEKYFNPSDNR